MEAPFSFWSLPLVLFVHERGKEHHTDPLGPLLASRLLTSHWPKPAALATQHPWAQVSTTRGVIGEQPRSNLWGNVLYSSIL